MTYCKSVSKIVFTRYLYLKDEVEASLLVSLLNKSEVALFWAYEIYFSGFENELFNLLLKIYYEFYASLNPDFETCLVKKYNKFLVCPKEKKKTIVAYVINNLLIRKYSLDVFMLKQIVNTYEIESSSEFLLIYLENKDYEKIANIVISVPINNLLHILSISIDHFSSKNLSINKRQVTENINQCIYSDKRIVVLSKIMHYYSLLSGFKPSKNLYVSMDSKDYDTIENGQLTTFRPYKVLAMACKYGTNDHSYLSVFKLKRNTLYSSYNDLKNEYYYNWTYYAFESPIWKNRVDEFSGFLDHKLRRIDFPNDDLFDEFYDHYGYEPDEQVISIREKNIPFVSNEKSCSDFYKSYQQNSVYIVDNCYLDELEVFVF